MSDKLGALKSQLGMLPREDRAELAKFLIDSLDPGIHHGVQTAWEAELDRRVGEIQSGRIVGKTAEELFGELRARFP